MSLILVKILILCKKVGARKHSSLPKSGGGLKPSGLIEVYAYAAIMYIQQQAAHDTWPTWQLCIQGAQGACALP